MLGSFSCNEKILQVELMPQKFVKKSVCFDFIIYIINRHYVNFFLEKRIWLVKWDHFVIVDFQFFLGIFSCQFAEHVIEKVYYKTSYCLLSTIILHFLQANLWCFLKHLCNIFIEAILHCKQMIELYHQYYSIIVLQYYSNITPALYLYCCFSRNSYLI